MDLSLPFEYPTSGVTLDSITRIETNRRDMKYPMKVKWADYAEDYDGYKYDTDVYMYHREFVLDEKEKDWINNNPIISAIISYNSNYKSFLATFYKNNKLICNYSNKTLAELIEIKQTFDVMEEVFNTASIIHFIDYKNIEGSQESIMYVNKYGAFYSIMTSAYSQIIFTHWREVMTHKDKKSQNYLAYVKTLELITKVFVLLSGMDVQIPNDYLDQIESYYYKRDQLDCITNAKQSPYVCKLAEIFFFCSYNIVSVIKALKKSEFVKHIKTYKGEDVFISQLNDIRVKLENGENLLKNVGLIKMTYQLTKSNNAINWKELSEYYTIDESYKILSVEEEAKMVNLIEPTDYFKIDKILNDIAGFCFKPSGLPIEGFSITDSLKIKTESLVPMITTVLNYFMPIRNVLYILAKKTNEGKKETLLFNYEKFLMTQHSSKIAIINNIETWIHHNRVNYDKYVRSILVWKNPAK